MIKRLMICFTFIITIVLLIRYNNITINIDDTDLRNVSIDRLSIGDSIKEINLKKYTESDRYSGNYMCKFNELIIDAEDNKINYLCGRFDENTTVISVNGKIKLKNINEVTEILGEKFKENWKDREQLLKARIYFDSTNNIKVEFIYSNFDNSLVGIELLKAKVAFL